MRTIYFFRCYVPHVLGVQPTLFQNIIRGQARGKGHAMITKKPSSRCHKREQEYELWRDLGTEPQRELGTHQSYLSWEQQWGKRAKRLREADKQIRTTLINITTGENWEYSLCPSTHETVQSLWPDFRIGEIAHFSEICHRKSLYISTLRKKTVSGRERNKKEVGIFA